MKTLTPDVDPAAFFRSLRRAPSRVLLLDYDGTLAPFHEERDRAVPHPGVREAVRAHLSTGGTRVVVVSGRALRDLRPLLGLEPPPELWGTHGWERYRPGSGGAAGRDGAGDGGVENGVERMDPGETARGALDRGESAARDVAPIGSVEVKPVSIAVHVRGMGPEEGEALLERIEERWRPIASEGGLAIHLFDGGIELRVPGRDKGTAVREILSTEPEGVVVAYLGDDLTDEDAFRSLEPRAEEGRALRVLVRDRLRETAADVWIRPPTGLLEFLERWREAASP